MIRLTRAIVIGPAILLALLPATLALAAPARLGEIAGPLRFQQGYAEDGALTLAVTNMSKLPQRLDGADVGIGGAGAGCQVSLPSKVLAPTESATIAVATSATFNRCLGLAERRRPASLGRDANRATMQVAPRLPGANAPVLRFSLAPPPSGRR